MSDARLGVALSGLYDCARISRELGISRAAAEKWMHACPKQYLPGLRKVYVRAEDLQRVLDDHERAA